MAGRPALNTVEYFPHYVASKKTIFTLQSLYGNDGYAFWFKLLEVLGESPDHFYKFCKPSEWLYLVSKSCVSEEKATKILETLVDLEAIDKKLYQHKVIWCENFVKKLENVYRKRSGNLPKKPIIVSGKVITGPEIDIYEAENTQSKVKESKVKEVKYYGEFQNVKFCNGEYEKLIKQFGKVDANLKIEKLSAYIASKGKKYKSHYATILNWARKESPTTKTCKSCDYKRQGHCDKNKVCNSWIAI